MAVPDFKQIDPPIRSVRLDTLVRLRWLSVIGQTIAVLVVRYGLEFELPVLACLAVIAFTAWLNIALRIRFRQSPRLEPDRAAWLLAFDIGELAVLLFLTGGLENPFAFLFLAPVLISATALPPRMTLKLGGFAILCTTGLAFSHYPLPWLPDNQLDFPGVYIFGVWLSILLAIGFIGIYAWLVTEEARQFADAISATELVLAREQHLSQLDGLAAAAAHALGTPLSTISLVARELERELEPDSPHAEDVRLLREQSQRCRDILARLTALSSEGELFDRMPLSALLEEVIAPHRHFGVAIDMVLGEHTPEPIAGRNAAIIYGLGNLVENAVDFAQERVQVLAQWGAEDVSITITDDGPGFAPEILNRIGEPYVRNRRRRRIYEEGKSDGLGLGLFIAKTLLERSGAALTFLNRPPPDHGARIRIVWNRDQFEQSVKSTSLESNVAAQ